MDGSIVNNFKLEEEMFTWKTEIGAKAQNLLPLELLRSGEMCAWGVYLVISTYMGVLSPIIFAYPACRLTLTYVIVQMLCNSSKLCWKFKCLPFTWDYSLTLLY